MNILNDIAEKREKLADLLKNKDNRVVLHNWLKTELAYTSNAIEGNTLTRKETERFKKFGCDEILARDKTSLDITWIKDASLTDLENLPEPDILAQSIVAGLRDALSAFGDVESELKK